MTKVKRPLESALSGASTDAPATRLAGSTGQEEAAWLGGILSKIMLARRSRNLPIILLCLAIIAVSTASILIRFAQRDAPSLVIATLRLAFATLLLGPVALLRHEEELRAFRGNRLVAAGFSGLFLAIHFATWITSLEFTSVASSVVFVSTGPLWVGLLSPLLLNERNSNGTRTGLALALAGGLAIALGSGCSWSLPPACPQVSVALRGREMFGNLLALIGAWSVAGYLMIGRRLRAGTGLVPYVFVVYGFAACALALLMWVFGQSPQGYSPQTYRWIFLLAVVPQLIGHSTYNWALGYLPATLVAVATLGEPIGSSLLAFLFLHETPSPALLAGGMLILIGVYIAIRQSEPSGPPSAA